MNDPRRCLPCPLFTTGAFREQSWNVLSVFCACWKESVAFEVAVHCCCMCSSCWIRSTCAHVNCWANIRGHELDVRFIGWQKFYWSVCVLSTLLSVSMGNGDDWHESLELTTNLSMTYGTSTKTYSWKSQVTNVSCIHVCVDIFGRVGHVCNICVSI